MSIKPFILEYPELKSMEIMCVGDFHIGDRFHSDKALSDIEEWVLAADNRFITIDGDIFNAAIASSVSDIYSEEYTLDECMGIFGDFIDRIGAEKILVCTDGNHDQRVWKSVGIDPVKYVCKSHGVRYSSGEAYITVKLGTYHDRNGKDKNRKVCYKVYVTHGVGGGRSSGGKLNNLMRLGEIVVADVYIQGHQHDPVIKPRVINEWDSQCKAVVEHNQMFVVTGSCLERGGYAVSKAYPPVCSKSPVLTLSGERKEIKASI